VLPSFPTTSSVAAATARILEAYLSNHKLSPAEAASLGGMIAQALGSLTSHSGVENETASAPGTEPASKRRGKSRVIAQARAPPPEPVAALPDPEPEAQPMAEAVVMVAEAEPEDMPELAAAPTQGYQPEAAGPAESPHKRKRPSRPRSKRGQGAGAAHASAAIPGHTPEHEAPSADEPRVEAVEAAPVDAKAYGAAKADGAAEGSSVAVVKPRRTAGRARRITTP
jgi:hypothetical protein